MLDAVSDLMTSASKAARLERTSNTCPDSLAIILHQKGSGPHVNKESFDLSGIQITLLCSTFSCRPKMAALPLSLCQGPCSKNASSLAKTVIPGTCLKSQKSVAVISVATVVAIAVADSRFSASSGGACSLPVSGR